MKIKDVRLLPLHGATPDGGWDEKFLDSENNLHTLVEVVTDEGVTGLGSVFTSAKLIEGAFDVVCPFLIGGSALDPAATSENLHQQSFWQGRGGAIDYVQPDVTKVGGISEEHRIAQCADDHSILFVPHGWNTAVGLAADLQLVAAAGNARWVEYITPAPYIEELLLRPIVLDADGMIAIPDGPGLGMQWNPDGIAKFTGGMQLTTSAV